MSTTATKTFSPIAIKREQNRRNKPKADRSRAQSWVFSALDNAALAAVAAGEIVEAKFKSGRVEHVGLTV